jgi:2-polyprenyl-3-methyl-5-hydroxy-6-metoxy-1,4-benzoquinol methylase
MNLVSSKYKTVLNDTHKLTENKWGGGHSVDKLPKYESLLKSLEVKTMLDYGCANGKFKVYMDKHKPQYEVYEYDPGIKGKDILPQPADFIVCCDVMEHVEPDLLDNVMNHLQSLVIKGGFFNISTKEAITLLSDGSNAHKIVKDGQWWIDLFSKYFEVFNTEINRIDTSFKVLPKIPRN